MGGRPSGRPASHQRPQGVRARGASLSLGSPYRFKTATREEETCEIDPSGAGGSGLRLGLTCRPGSTFTVIHLALMSGDGCVCEVGPAAQMTANRYPLAGRASRRILSPERTAFATSAASGRQRRRSGRRLRWSVRSPSADCKAAALRFSGSNPLPTTGKARVRHLRRWGAVYVLTVLFVVTWFFQWWNERDLIAYLGWNRFWSLSFASWNGAFLVLILGWVVLRTTLDDLERDRIRMEAKLDLLLLRLGVDVRPDHERDDLS